MSVEKLQQSLLIGLFKTITRKEREEVLQREVEELCNESGNQNNSKLPENVEKCIVGRPRKFVAILQFERQIKKEANEEEDVENKKGSKPKSQKSRGQCTNWLQPNLWPSMMTTIQKYGANSDVVHCLRIAHQSPGVPNPYENQLGATCGLGLHQKENSNQITYKQMNKVQQ